MGSDIGLEEAEFWAGGADDSADDRGDFVAAGDVILLLVKECCKGGVAGSIVVEKLHHLVI